MRFSRIGREKLELLPLVTADSEAQMLFDCFDYWKIRLEVGEIRIAFMDFVDVADKPFVDERSQSRLNFRPADDKDEPHNFYDILRLVHDLHAPVSP